MGRSGSVIACSLPSLLSSQCTVQWVDLDSRIHACEFLIYGEVIDQEAAWDGEGRAIVTYHTLKVHKTYKGAVVSEEITLLTLGGIVGNEMTKVDPSLKLEVGDRGLFTLNHYQGCRLLRETAYQPTYSTLSYVKHDNYANIYIDGRNTYDKSELEFQITSVLDSEVKLPGFKGNQQFPMLMPSISNITPLNRKAGIGDTITITGLNFGATAGTVFFRNADSGGSNFIGTTAAHIVSWSATSIVVEVRSRAGNGTIFIQDNGGVLSPISSQSLNIEYNVSNVTDSGGQHHRTYLVDDAADGDMGYKFVYSTSTANMGVDFTNVSGAMESFERALASWQTQGYSIYADNGGCGTTSIQCDSDDGVNIVSFDSDSCALTGSVIGTAYSQFQKCGSSEWELTGIDVIFRRNGTGVTWEFGPANPSGSESDFETVALHEIGHTHQLGHVINSGAVMHFSITNGTTNRVLGTEDVNGSNYVESNATGYSPPIIACGLDFNSARQYGTYLVANDCFSPTTPVEYLSFTAHHRDGDVELDWSTVSEINNDRFEVLRSSNGGNFEKIGTIAGTGNITSQQDYSFTDRNVNAGMGYYYRLRQIDYNGSEDYSDVIYIYIPGDSRPTILPNPVENVFSTVGGTYQFIEILNNEGKLVMKFDANDRLRYDISRLSASIYFVRFVGKHQVWIEKLSKI